MSYLACIAHASRLGWPRWGLSRAARCALAFAIAWIGALKFTTYDAKSTLPLMTSSPLMSWV
ncbi:DUF417 family protein [Mycobacterium sp. PSTR-4-N]|uniref:DUF417 family protein n=1 Tax=Mycobacteriaceae TaxID=1762 RepID=UPI000DA1C815|nr:DUF417 family protein [Mycolicibacterium neoaurum]